MSLSPAERLALLPAESQREILEASGMSDVELDDLERDWRFWARPEQLAPGWAWFIWAIITGRGWGKTRTGAEWVLDRVTSERVSVGRRIALVARTAADTRDTMVEGESGLAECAERRKVRLRYEPSKRRLTWPDHDALATTFSADEPDQLRGPQHDSAWVDEPAAWRLIVDAVGNTAWSNLMFGLRLGDEPQCVATTTPKPVPLVRELIERAAVRDAVALTTGTLYDNVANLAEPYVREIVNRYGGTRLGAQEIRGLLLDEIEGALWTAAGIEADRVTDHPALREVVVAVDPPGSEHGAECGIIVAGSGHPSGETDVARRHAWVLDDSSLQGSPETWARAVVAAFHRHSADRVVAEVNNGGDMVAAVIENVDRRIHVEQVRATRGKQVRAQPVAGLYEQHRVHHLGYFGDLEAQMVSWVPGDPSPDRLDALVWAVSSLMGDMNRGPARTARPSGRVPATPRVRQPRRTVGRR